MLTRVQNDACSIGDRDERNAEQYAYSLSNLPNYRRDEPLEAQQYASRTGGLEQNWSLDNKLRGLHRVLNSCNLYGAGVQAEVQASADPIQTVCLGNALAPTYSRMTKVARNQDIYQSQRAKPIDWHFYTPAVPYPNYGVYEVNRYADTRQNAKDALETDNKQWLKREYKGYC